MSTRVEGIEMKAPSSKRKLPEAEPVRVLGRGLRAQRGVRLPIRVVREAAGKTQVEVATAAGIDQADISRLERRADFDDCQVGTLRRYVDALGGNLELVAVFGTKRITLSKP
jgi:DNA-binding XRE family transcriptional regulator